VQLTNDPRLEINPRITFSDRVNKIRWASLSANEETVIKDAVVSFEALAWDLVEGVPSGGGIYDALIEFDDDGNVVGLLAAPDPEQPIVDVPVFAHDPDNDGTIDDWRTRSFGFDWAPDGTALTWGEAPEDALSLLHVVDLLAPNPQSIPIAELELNGNPRWSPDGSRIAIALYDGIATIAPDGSSLDIIVRNSGGKKTISSLGVPVWSPDGAHLIYSQFEWNQNSGSTSRDIYRVTSTGRGKTNLTTDIGGDPFGVQWR